MVPNQRARATRSILAPSWIAGIVLLATTALAACGANDSAAPAKATPSPAISTGATPAPSAATSAGAAGTPHADITLSRDQADPVTVKVGQIINIPDDPSFSWDVNYRPEVLLALTPPEQISKPGPAGWFFRAIGAGNTEITLESVPPPCPSGKSCPPNTIRLVFPITVVQ